MQLHNRGCSSLNVFFIANEPGTIMLLSLYIREKHSNVLFEGLFY